MNRRGIPHECFSFPQIIARVGYKPFVKYGNVSVSEELDCLIIRPIGKGSLEALAAFSELGGDVVVKPVFGSRGVGATRINDRDVASTVFNAIRFAHGLIYLQEFVNHGFSDLRAFVVGKRVVAAMRRVAKDWKTNYSQGARPTTVTLEGSLEEMAVKAAQLIECKVAGVDILESPEGPVVVEVNSQPGWKGLQSVTRVKIADEILDFVLSELRR